MFACPARLRAIFHRSSREPLESQLEDFIEAVASLEDQDDSGAALARVATLIESVGRLHAELQKVELSLSLTRSEAPPLRSKRTRIRRRPTAARGEIRSTASVVQGIAQRMLDRGLSVDTVASRLMRSRDEIAALIAPADPAGDEAPVIAIERTTELLAP